MWKAAGEELQQLLTQSRHHAEGLALNMRKHQRPSVVMSPCSTFRPKSSSMRVTSQPRPVASGQLIRTSR